MADCGRGRDRVSACVRARAYVQRGCEWRVSTLPSLLLPPLVFFTSVAAPEVFFKRGFRGPILPATVVVVVVVVVVATVIAVSNSVNRPTFTEPVRSPTPEFFSEIFPSRNFLTTPKSFEIFAERSSFCLNKIRTQTLDILRDSSSVNKTEKLRLKLEATVKSQICLSFDFN